MKISKTFSLEDGLLKWLDEKSESKKMSLSEFATFCFEKERKSNQVNVRSSSALEEESKLAFQKAEDLKYMAINRKIEEQENEVEARREVERVMDFQKKVRIKSHEEMVSDANDWVSKLDPIKLDEFRQYMRKSQMNILAAYEFALSKGFPANELPISSEL